MEQKEFKFDEATPLQKFIDKYRDRVVGHILKACYTELGIYVTSENTSQPVFLVLDHMVIGVDYLYRGHVSIFTAEESDFEFEETEERERIDFTFRSRIPGRDGAYGSWRTDMPAMNQKVTDITIGRHSERYEDYPNSERPEGGDYFSWLQLKLEDGTTLSIYAEDSINDGYVDVWLSDMPAYKYIKAELDKAPDLLNNSVHEGFDQIMWHSNPQPDELAELAMYYMHKCDHEIENYRKEKGPLLPYRSLYTFQLKHILEEFKIHEMNIDYVDPSGKSLIDLALEIGEEASSRALPSIYYETLFSSSLKRIARSMESDYNILMLQLKEAAEIYSALPKKVQRTSYGQKLLKFSRNHYTGLKKLIDKLRSDLDKID